MKVIFYHYNSTRTLFLSYSDGNGGYTDHAYVFYSLREAIQQFRREYGLQCKHIRVIKLYYGERPLLHFEVPHGFLAFIPIAPGYVLLQSMYALAYIAVGMRLPFTFLRSANAASNSLFLFGVQR